jgi:hypothetical protein
MASSTYAGVHQRSWRKTLNERLIKRLQHNMKRITEPTVKQLLADCLSYIGNERQPDGDTRSITCLEGGQYPKFKAGVPINEGEGLVTAEYLNELVFRLKLADTGTQSVQLNEKDQEAVKELTDMMLLMERASYTAVSEGYRTSRLKWPRCVTAMRSKGVLTEFLIELEDGSSVTLRNPECVAKEQSLHTSAAANATPSKTEQEEQPT